MLTGSLSPAFPAAGETNVIFDGGLTVKAELLILLNWAPPEVDPPMVTLYAVGLITAIDTGI